jgi:predicted Fe-Mo cluster-binding NifX family protein
MLLAYPVLESDGLNSPISGHFGKAPLFLVVDDTDCSCAVYSSGMLRSEGECAPLRALAGMGVAEVHCLHMGRGALQRCVDHGLKVFQTTASTIAEALSERAHGQCPDLPDEALCGGHAHESHCH